MSETFDVHLTTPEAKQVLVVRKDLKMRKGKIGAQCAHASMKVLLDEMSPHLSTPRGAEHLYIRSLFMHQASALFDWLNGAFTKVVVYVNSEQELDDLAKAAKDKKLLHAMIVDQGRTEFHGVPTKTVLAIGPAWDYEIDEITGDLPLL